MRQTVLLVLALSSVARADLFPPAHELFAPLRADPRELQYALRVVVPVSHKLLGEAAMGDYLGLTRWSILGGSGQAQWNIGGGAFGRFDLAGDTNDMQSVDFYANTPLDARVGPWSTRFMLYHTSSHLGDDYLKATGLTTEKHSWDNLRWLVSYEPTLYCRVYGGYTYAFRTLPQHVGRHALQGGFELQSAWHAHGHAQFYWANDFQSWERAHWNPALNSQAGIMLLKDPAAKRGLSIFVEFSAGRVPQGQFYLEKETRWSGGIQFHLT